MQKRPMQAGRWRNANAATPMQQRQCRNADAATPMQQCQCRNADAATPPWNATAQKQCAAMGFVCPTLRKKLSKRASELASKLPSMQPASKLAGLRSWALRRGIRGGFRRLLRCRLRRLRLVPLRALAGSWSCRIPVLRCWRRGRSPERRRRLSFQ